MDASDGNSPRQRLKRRDSDGASSVSSMNSSSHSNNSSSSPRSTLTGSVASHSPSSAHSQRVDRQHRLRSNNSMSRSTHNGNSGGNNTNNPLMVHWKTAFLVWSMCVIGVLRIHQQADPISLIHVVNTAQLDQVQLHKQAQNSMLQQAVENGIPKTPLTSREIAQQKRRHLGEGKETRKTNTLLNVNMPDPKSKPVQAIPTNVRGSGQVFENEADVLDGKEEEEIVEAAQQQEEEASRPEEDASAALVTTTTPTLAPTPPPTQFTYYHNKLDVVHVIHSHFYDADAITQPNRLRIQLETWKRVTLPSLRHQTSQEFLYIVWIDQKKFTDELLLDLQLAVEQDGGLEQAVILNVPQAQMVTDIRSPWFSNAKRLEAATYAGQWQRIRDYHNSADTRIVLDTMLEPSDGLLKDFAATIQKEASQSLVSYDTDKKSKSTNYQVWCSDLYLEWRLDNPWNAKSKRGLLQGQVHLQNGKHQQCDFTSGLTKGYQVGTPAITYTVEDGIALADVPHRAWSDYLPRSFLTKGKKQSGQLPSCQDHPKNCIRYIDVGLYEYGVVRVRSLADSDLTTVPVSAQTDERWRTLQDKMFSLLQSRFGINPKIMFAVKPFLMERRVALLQEQQSRHSQACGGQVVLQRRRKMRRLGQVINQDESIDAESLEKLLASASFPETCNPTSQAVVEDILAAMEEEIEELKRKEQEAEMLRKEKEVQALRVHKPTNTVMEEVEEDEKTKALRIKTALSDTVKALDAAQLVSDQKVQELTNLAKEVKAKQTAWKNGHNVVHVVQSRFMQHQAQLVNLGKARIDLFRTFTVPSMRHQTNQEYLWVIWTDPDLHPSLLQQLFEEIKDFPNIVVIGDANIVNEDFRQSINGLGADPPEESILFGSRDLLLSYHSASQSRILLETRLDADDALSSDFLETVQHEATNSISQEDKTDYRVWCANRYVDWRYYSPTQESEGSRSDSDKGFLAPEQDMKGCVTVGLTMGFQTEAGVDQLPTKEHHRIRETLTSCKKSAKHCVRGLFTPDNQFFALRARTPTSTSMVNVVVSEDGSAMELAQKNMWESIERDFAIGQRKVWALRDRFEKNLPEILLDAIAGLCKAGHSCRQSSKAMLTKLLKEAVAAAQEKEMEEKDRGSPDQNARVLVDLLRDALNTDESKEEVSSLEKNS